MIGTLVDTLHQMSFTDVLIIAGLLGYLLDRLADSRGWSRSSKTLRLENEDLVRRNSELEQTVSRHESLIASLQQQVSDLKRSDQAAVLVALKDHEVGAVERAKKTHELQAETNTALDRIVVVLETQTGGAA